ncbi:DUF309 domain-containing protein [Sporosarcina highlanderae]|uniref:DUF309 domain-containing protein n=1 Tax=Sporosarcina highlanderae TaxID=3035916 RepID=A0ABT8JT42_9BACL|nr:DUF309 domain-containing protein [Sporosarcina highlanderae]MDN4607319.1 DUF309 domain-containing protein [Sporosarcina highlanderae]
MDPTYHPLFLKFICYFNKNQDYFECHEVLEEYWKSIPNYTKEHPLTAYILLSTGLYHWRRDNFNGAFRTLLKAKQRMLDQDCHMSGIDGEKLVKDINQSIDKVKNTEPFSLFTLSLTSEKLKVLVEETASTMELLPRNSNAVIHKHMLRDRSDILEQREKKKGRPF